MTIYQLSTRYEEVPSFVWVFNAAIPGQDGRPNQCCVLCLKPTVHATLYELIQNVQISVCWFFFTFLRVTNTFFKLMMNLSEELHYNVVLLLILMWHTKRKEKLNWRFCSCFQDIRCQHEHAGKTYYRIHFLSFTFTFNVICLSSQCTMRR